MRQSIIYKAIKKFDATIKARELVAQIQAEMKEKIGQISESGMEKLAVRLGEAQLELAQLRLKLVPWYDGRDKYALRKALKHAERELANLNVYLGFVNKPGNKPSKEELDGFREAVWSDLMCELVDNFNAALEERWQEEEREDEAVSRQHTRSVAVLGITDRVFAGTGDNSVMVSVPIFIGVCDRVAASVGSELSCRSAWIGCWPIPSFSCSFRPRKN